MKVWLDDERPIPVGYDRHVRTAAEAIDLLSTGTVSEISLDHDLGPPEAGTGYDVTKYLIAAAYHEMIPAVICRVHSANPVGRKNMLDNIKTANRLWEKENV